MIFIYSILVFLGGMADGIYQTLITRYGNFSRKHPKANPLFWNPDISWKNKYKDYDNGDKRAKFPFSKGALVLFTDGYHLTQAARNILSLIGFSGMFALLGYEKEWYIYVFAWAGLYTIFRSAFELVYNIIYKLT